MNRKFKMIIDPHCDSAMAMEKDLELLASADDALVVRVYSWNSPAISLGRLQNPSLLLDLDKVQRDGVQLVSRPTGGRHVYHSGDISFTLIIPRSFDAEIGGTIRGRNAWIAELFANLFHKLGVDLEKSDVLPDRNEIADQRNKSCFTSSVQGELVWTQRKLFGAAQRVESHAVLVQGTVPVTKDYLNIADYELAGTLSERRQYLQSLSISLAELCVDQKSFSMESFGSALTASLEDLGYHMEEK